MACCVFDVTHVIPSIFCFSENSKLTLQELKYNSIWVSSSGKLIVDPVLKRHCV